MRHGHLIRVTFFALGGTHWPGLSEKEMHFIHYRPQILAPQPTIIRVKLVTKIYQLIKIVLLTLKNKIQEKSVIEIKFVSKKHEEKIQFD